MRLRHVPGLQEFATSGRCPFDNGPEFGLRQSASDKRKRLNVNHSPMLRKKNMKVYRRMVIRIHH